MYQQLWGYKVEEKLYLGVREQKRLNTTELGYGEAGWIQVIGIGASGGLLSTRQRTYCVYEMQGICD
jgi:hypothetical protein